MERWDEDFSTLKGPSKYFHARKRSLSAWKPDIPIVDADQTLRRNQMPPTFANSSAADFGDDDEDFADEFEAAVRVRRSPMQQNYPGDIPDAFISDASSSKSPSRASVSSAASASSAATSWEGDFGLEFDEDELPNSKLDLAARLKARQERARAEANAEAAALAANYAKTITRNRTLEKKFAKAIDDEDDDILDVGLEQLTLRVKNGTVNKHVKLQPPSAASNDPPSKIVRGMRSIAQFSHKKNQSSLPQARLRAAVSMMDLGSTQIPHNFAYTTQQQQQPATIVQRPLTMYKEPVKKHNEYRKHKTKKPNLIQNPLPTLKRQERNGMVLNPQTGLWEGNDIDDSRFEHVDSTVKPTLITKQSIDEQNVPQAAAPNGMLFDKRTLSWIYANEDEYDDPFAEIEYAGTPTSSPSPSPRRPSGMPFTPSHAHAPSTQSFGSSARKPSRMSLARASRMSMNDEIASGSGLTASSYGRASVARSESTGKEVFEVSPRMVAEWKYGDERFMRKFGKWIGGDKEKEDALKSDQQFYEMVRNA